MRRGSAHLLPAERIIELCEVERIIGDSLTGHRRWLRELTDEQLGNAGQLNGRPGASEGSTISVSADGLSGCGPVLDHGLRKFMITNGPRPSCMDPRIPLNPDQNPSSDTPQPTMQ